MILLPVAFRCEAASGLFFYGNNFLDSILVRISHQNVMVGQANRYSGGASVAASGFAFLQGVEQRLIGLHSPTKSLCDLDPPYR